MEYDILPYLNIPIVSGIVGWGTNVLALQMTFYPLEYAGIRPFGWQGIIPSKAKKMAEKSVDLLTIKLLRIDEQFEKLDPVQVAEEMQDTLEEMSKEIIDEVMDSQIPAIWKRTPEAVKHRVYTSVAKQMPDVVIEVMRDMKEHIKELIDLKKLSVSILMRDKGLVNEIFLRCGREEFKFIRRSGFYFGFLFGLVQALVYFYFDPWWILPLFGVLVGFATNWLAIKMIFKPTQPYKVGPFRFQGLFLKRQQEVAEEYSSIISSKILTTEAMFNFMLRGPGAEKMGAIMQRHVEEVIDQSTGVNKGIIEWVAGGEKLTIIKNIAFFRFKQELPIYIQSVFQYAEEALDIRNSLRDKMQALSPNEFEGFLRPAFQEDETTLILVGAFLGGLAGLLQYFIFFAGLF